MNKNFDLKELLVSHHPCVRSIYEDAIQSQCQDLYSREQIIAWSSLAWLPGILDRTLNEGKGWISTDNDLIEAFAVRYPINRLALIYCRGRSARQGHATQLLKQIEADALVDGQSVLITEASLLSYPLLLRYGWSIKSLEKIKISGISFDRYLMIKKLI